MAPPAEGLTREALGELYARYAPVVFRRARRLLGRDADAWDVVQEVFERMVKSGASFRFEARPTTWVWRITTNACLNALRARGVREPVLSAVEDEGSDEGVTGIEARELLAKWLQHLDEREVTIATLLFLDGLTQDEVADVLGLSRKTIGREVAELRAKAQALGALPDGGAGHE
jgi:RNA polymerase sigma-70 factor (ECF subfamily)